MGIGDASFRPTAEIRLPDRDFFGLENRVAGVNTWTPRGFSETWTITSSVHCLTLRFRRRVPLTQPWPPYGVARRCASGADGLRWRRWSCSLSRPVA